MRTGREIRLVEEDDGWWSAIDEATEIASQGESRRAALDTLDEAIAAAGKTMADGSPAPTPEVPWFERE
ncbi:MAG: type II toxin-antitoxin system HicB family antitoxin [Halanaeroarchaeum sp.]